MVKKCPYCKDRFNWNEAVPVRCLTVTIQNTFRFPDMVHMRRWLNGRIENYQRCKEQKDIFIIKEV